MSSTPTDPGPRAEAPRPLRGAARWLALFWVVAVVGLHLAVRSGALRILP